MAYLDGAMSRLAEGLPPGTPLAGKQSGLRNHSIGGIFLLLWISCPFQHGQSVFPRLPLGIDLLKPFHCGVPALLPGVAGLVAKVLLSLVSLDGEGGAGHCQGVRVEDRRIGAEWFQQPLQEDIEQSDEVEEKVGHQGPGAQNRETTGTQELHVEVLVALVRGVVIAEIHLAPNDRGTLLDLLGY